MNKVSVHTLRNKKNLGDSPSSEQESLRTSESDNNDQVTGNMIENNQNHDDVSSQDEKTENNNSTKRRLQNTINTTITHRGKQERQKESIQSTKHTSKCCHITRIICRIGFFLFILLLCLSPYIIRYILQNLTISTYNGYTQPKRQQYMYKEKKASTSKTNQNSMNQDDDEDDWVIPNDDDDDESYNNNNNEYQEYDDGNIHIQVNGDDSGNNDILSSIFGGLFGNQNRVHKEFSVSLKDIYLGTTRREVVQLGHTCPTCQGQGVLGHACDQCHGQGVIFTQGGFMHCPKCGGQGFVAERHCPKCGGTGQIQENIPVEITIEKGTEDGKIYSQKHYDQLLRLRLHIIEHPIYKRDGNNLLMTHIISITDSLLGFSHTLNHIDGHKYDITSTSILNDGDIITIQGEGMPYINRRNKYGDLLVTIKIQFPESLTEQQKEGIRKYLPDN